MITCIVIILCSSVGIGGMHTLPSLSSWSRSRWFRNRIVTRVQILCNVSYILFVKANNSWLQINIQFFHNRIYFLNWKEQKWQLAWKSKIRCNCVAYFNTLFFCDLDYSWFLYFREFQSLALELLEHCYKLDDDYTQQLMTYEIKSFSETTNLALAVSANHRQFIAHTACQVLLNDLWIGGLRMRKNSSMKVRHSECTENHLLEWIDYGFGWSERTPMIDEQVLETRTSIDLRVILILIYDIIAWFFFPHQQHVVDFDYDNRVPVLVM